MTEFFFGGIWLLSKIFKCPKFAYLIKYFKFLLFSPFPPFSSFYPTLRFIYYFPLPFFQILAFKGKLYIEAIQLKNWKLKKQKNNQTDNQKDKKRESIPIIPKNRGQNLREAAKKVLF